MEFTYDKPNDTAQSPSKDRSEWLNPQLSLAKNNTVSFILNPLPPTLQKMTQTYLPHPAQEVAPPANDI